MLTYQYLVAGSVVGCDHELVGAPIADPTARPDFRVRTLAAEILPPAAEPAVPTVLNNGRCMVDIGPYAKFEISSDGSEIVLTPGIETGPSALHHILVDHAIPQRFALVGHTALHATAVDLGGGAVAMLGSSGRGKSTLSGALVADGASWVADDFLLLEVTEHNVIAKPTAWATRLCEDSAAALGRDHGQGDVIMDDAAKRRWNIDATKVAPVVELRCMFLLERRDDEHGEITCTRADPATALSGIATQRFLAGTSAVAPRSYLSEIAAILRHVPVFVLSYPNNFSRLGEVVDAVKIVFDRHSPVLAGASEHLLSVGSCSSTSTTSGGEL